MRTALRFLLALTLATTAVVAVQPSAVAAADPSFRVVCYPTGIAKNDPIVFPGQAGLSHMHTFYGAKGVDEDTSSATLAAATSSQCGSYFDGVDNSAYWIPTLYKDGQQVYTTSGLYQLHAYYQRAGGPEGALVDQAWPRGLKIIAGDMHATTPQQGILYFCANSTDTGNQGKASTEFPSCASNETLVARLTFPDCWDGKYLDSANHKSHMAYSSGERNTCPADHPVKLAQLTMEAWFFNVNGDGSEFNWASGGPYTFHGDVFSMWQPQAAANLVNQCINVAFDCNPLIYPNIPVGPVTQAQIDAQYTGVEPSSTASPTASATPTMTMSMDPSPTASAAPTMTMSMDPSPTASAAPTMTMSMDPSPTASAAPTMTTSPTASAAPTMTTSPTASAAPTMTTSPTASATPTMTTSPTVPVTTSPSVQQLTSAAPEIRGSETQFLTLRVRTGAWGPAPVTFSYQWKRDGEPVDRATKPTYRLSRADIGAMLTVSVTGSKQGYASVTQTSLAVGPVRIPAWLFAQTGVALKAV